MKLSLAIALALACSNAFALGLGTIQVKSGLNQPLDAEIPVLTESAAEASELTVDLASAEDFERVGLNRARLTVPLEMAVTTNAKGQTVIKITTKDVVREPLIDFLIVANWTKGKVLREYTVLLDPPITAPPARGSAATVAPVAEKPAPTPQPLAESKAPPKPARPEPKPPVAAAPQKPPKAAPAPAPAAPAQKPAAAPAAAGNDYGPVAQGETLSEIARATRPDEKTSINQMMLALLKANPKAFYQDNINALRRGAILRIPSSDDIRASGAAREAAAQVHSQNEAWMSKAPVTAPTLVAHTGGPAKSTAETAAPAKPAKSEAGTKQERLALVPPRAGKSEAGADHAGAAGGTGKENADLKAELARTKETLTSREQEASELKSRVKQLEDLNSKDQRLISMKDSEIADLQAKLKELQAKEAASAKAAAAAKPAAETPPAPATAAAAKPEQKVTAKDIWGDMSAADKSAAEKAAASKSAATTTSAPTATTPTAPTATLSTPAPATPPPPPPATSAATTASAAATTATGASAPAASTTETSASATKPEATTAVAPVKSAPAAKVVPLEPAGEPFYKNQNVLLGGGAALLLVGLLALMRFMRKPKPLAAGGVAEGQGDLGPEAAHEEEHLLDVLRQDPGNTAASLELLRHYYARGDAPRFEAAAEQMHSHLMDPAAPEWDEVLAMGAVLVPHNPLFGEGTAAAAGGAHGQAEPHEEFVFNEPMHTQSGTFDDRPMHAQTTAHEPEEHFDYDLPVRTEEVRPEMETLHDQALPEFAREQDLHVAEAPVVMHEVPRHEPAAAAPLAEELIVGEDAIGTKLDLAKAYLDMGDPEGARSMLDEVMSEGNDTQKDEARKLLAEIK